MLFSIGLLIIGLGRLVESKETINGECTSTIYCQGTLLEQIQMARVFSDSKTFVDMPTKFTEKEVNFY